MDDLIEHFRDKERRKEFFKEYKEIEMLYEIISPDAFLRPFIDDYTTLSSIYAVVRNAYAKTGLCRSRRSRRRPTSWCRSTSASSTIGRRRRVRDDRRDTIELIKQEDGGDDTKVINLVKSIEKTAEENSDDPFLVALAERAKAVQESFEDRQTSTAEALDELFEEIERNEARKKEQAEKGFDGLTYFVCRKLLDGMVGTRRRSSQKVARGLRAVPELAAERSRAAGTAEASDLRRLRRRGRPRESDARPSMPCSPFWRRRSVFEAMETS